MVHQTQIRATVTLPDNFRQHEFLALHQRDQENIAEKVVQNTLSKGLYWENLPACLTIHLTPEVAQVKLNADGDLQDKDNQALIHMVKKMLGLWQPIEQFESRFCHHPQIGQLVSRNTGLWLVVIMVIHLLR